MDDAFQVLFDGASLDGWQMCGSGRFIVNDGTMVSEGGMGLLWYSRKRFRDFILRLDWKASRREDNSGVFVRFPDLGNDPWIAVSNGYEVQIYDAEPEDGNNNRAHRTGAIYDFAAPRSIASGPPGSWNNFEIHAIGHRYAVILNEKKVTEFTGSRLLEGYIGVQNHDADSRVAFRNIAIKELWDSSC
jgi:Domain of Unknown Function (DUF1080)